MLDGNAHLADISKSRAFPGRLDAQEPVMAKIALDERTAPPLLKRADAIAGTFWSPFDRNGRSGFVLAMLAVCGGGE